MTTPAELVESTFNRAVSYAASAQASLTSFTNALNAAVYAPPTISVTWAAIAAPSLPSLPSQPSFPTIAFAAPTAPDALTIDTPTLTVDSFAEVAPTTTFASTPVVVYDEAPTVPDVADIAVPSAPTVTLPSVPVYLGLSTPTFGGLDLHESYLDNLTTIPTLTLVSPTPYNYNRGPEYASALLTDMKLIVASRLGGGTGLDPAVEQAIWDRSRSRETVTWQANQSDITRSAEALGFALPAGVVAAQLEAAQQTYYNKVSELSRDIAIKQADLEQENLKQAIEVGMQLESRLLDYSLQYERIAFESAKEVADNAIAIYNAQIEKYKSLLSAYQTYAAAYDTIIKGQLAKVDAFKAEIAAEQAKADHNRALVEQYKAGVEAAMAVVEIFKAQVAGAQTLVTIEQAKISAAGERIRAYIAQVNAETAKVEAYKASVQAEATKVEVYKVKAEAFAVKVGAQAEVAKANITRFEALHRAKTGEWEGYKARVGAEEARLKALASQSGTLLDAYKAAAAAIEASANMHTRIWEGQIKNYEASQQITIQAAKINGDNAMHSSAARLDAAKVGAQIYAQITASAYGMMKASTQTSASGNNSVQWQYQNDTSWSPSPVTAV